MVKMLIYLTDKFGDGIADRVFSITELASSLATSNSRFPVLSLLFFTPNRKAP